MKTLRALLFLTAGSIGCGSGNEPPVDLDMGAEVPDVGSPDAGSPDGGSIDGGEPDVGTADVGLPDLPASTCPETPCSAELVCGPTGSCQSGGAGAPCTDAALHCQTDLLCASSGECQAGRLGDDCLSDSDCDPNADGTIYACGEANTCEVVDCLTTADCDVGDTCDLLTGACLSCEGIATLCSLRNASQCTEGFGCVVDSFCGGVPTECRTYPSRIACERQIGCFWATGQGCSGVLPPPCLVNDLAACRRVPGCTWIEACAGDATSCSSLDTAMCSVQPGCAPVGSMNAL